MVHDDDDQAIVFVGFNFFFFLCDGSHQLVDDLLLQTSKGASMKDVRSWKEGLKLDISM